MREAILDLTGFPRRPDTTGVEEVAGRIDDEILWMGSTVSQERLEAMGGEYAWDVLAAFVGGSSFILCAAIAVAVVWVSRKQLLEAVVLGVGIIGIMLLIGFLTTGPSDLHAKHEAASGMIVTEDCIVSVSPWGVKVTQVEDIDRFTVDGVRIYIGGGRNAPGWVDDPDGTLTEILAGMAPEEMRLARLTRRVGLD